MLKRFAVFTLVLLLVVTAVTGCTSTNDKPGGNEQQGNEGAGVIKLGIAVPMTGGSAELGGRVYRGAKLAVDEINAAGGLNGKMIEFVSMDDRADPKEAANVANLFAADKDMLAVIAGYNSSCTLAGAPIYNKNNLVHIAVGSSSPKVSDAGEYTFRVWNSDVYRAAVDLQIALDEGYEKYGIVYQNDDFGVGALNVAKNMLAENGFEALVAEGFLLGETKDFNTIITKMKDAGCDAVFAIADESELAAFVKQCAAQGYKPFITSTGTYNPAVISLGGEDVEGIVGDGFFDPANKPAKAAAFFEKYNAAFPSATGEAVEDPTSPCAYDAIYMIAQAIEDGVTTREEMQQYLANLKDFDGVVGTLSFDENGDVKIPLIPITIKDGQFVLFEGSN